MIKRMLITLQFLLILGTTTLVHAASAQYEEWKIQWLDAPNAAKQVTSICAEVLDRDGRWYDTANPEAWIGSYSTKGSYGAYFYGIKSNASEALTFSLEIVDRTATSLKGVYIHMDQATGKSTTHQALLTKSNKPCAALQ